MMNKRVHLFLSLVFLVALLALASATEAAQTPAARTQQATSGCQTPTLDTLVEQASTAVCPAPDVVEPAPAAPGEAPGIFAAVTIHCCSQAAIEACSTTCKDIFPGCKGQVGCRAGECVCTCNCP